jgi:hypothetical protein
VNVYSGTAWASDEYFIRVRNELSYRKATGELFRVNQDQLLHLRHSIAELRRAFAGALLHRLRHGHRVRAPLLKAHLATDPLSFLAIPGAALRILSRHQ